MSFEDDIPRITGLQMSAGCDGLKISVKYHFGMYGSQELDSITITEDDMRRAFPNLFPEPVDSAP